MFYALILLLLFGNAAMAKDSPIIPQSKLGTVVPNEDDDFDQLMQRLDAEDETVWEDLYKSADRSKARKKILEATPRAPELKNVR